MLWVYILALLLAMPLHAIAQSSDLQVDVSAAPTSGLAIGSEVVVTTSVTNAGPDAATGVSVDVAGIPFQAFPFEIVGSETPGCSVEALDIAPVVFNYNWQIGALGAHAERACAVRLRVRAMPAPTVPLSASVFSNTLDPNSFNNSVSLFFAFGVTDLPRVVPSLSWHGILLLAFLVWVVLQLRTNGETQ